MFQIFDQYHSLADIWRSGRTQEPKRADYVHDLKLLIVDRATLTSFFISTGRKAKEIGDEERLIIGTAVREGLNHLRWGQFYSLAVNLDAIYAVSNQLSQRIVSGEPLCDFWWDCLRLHARKIASRSEAGDELRQLITSLQADWPM